MSAASAQTVAFNFNGGFANSFLGTAVDAIGDADGDGVVDYIAGAPFDSSLGSLTGVARVFSGATGLEVYTSSSGVTGSAFGTAVSAAGDVNNDGFQDYIVGAPAIFLSGQIGYAYVYSGFDGSQLYALNDGLSGTRFGQSVGDLGDINGDGFDDVIVGAIQDPTNGSNAGAAHIYSGLDGSQLFSVFRDSAEDLFGFTVTGIGDINNDNIGDFAVGAIADDNLTNNGGSVRVFSGANAGVLFTFDGGDFEAELGYGLSSAGDFDRDGTPDIAAGAPFADHGGTDTGRVYVYSGATGVILSTVDGANPSEVFGYAVDCADDLNRDGFDDVIVGAPGASNLALNAGGYRVISGRDSSLLMSVDGTNAQNQFGFSVSGSPDINGDGFPDSFVGIRLDDTTGTNAGQAQVILSSTLPVLRYQSDLGPQKLQLDWTPDNNDPFSLTGSIQCKGATFGGTGLFGVSYAPTDFLLSFGFPLLIAVDPANLIDSGNFGFDFSGSVNVQAVSRQFPAIAGLYVFIQFYEVTPSPGSSNGIAMLMAP